MKKTINVCDKCQKEIGPQDSAIWLHGSGASMDNNRAGTRDARLAFKVPEGDREAVFCWACVFKQFGPLDSVMVR